MEDRADGGPPLRLLVPWYSASLRVFASLRETPLTLYLGNHLQLHRHTQRQLDGPDGQPGVFAALAQDFRKQF